MKQTPPFATLALFALTACGGGLAEPTPTPPVTVARIAYTTDAALLFTGKVVPVRALVRGYDAAGVELPTSVLAITLSPGWALRGDSVVATADERTGTLRASGKARASLASRALGGVATDSTALTAGVDLRGYDWTASWRCVQAPATKSIISERGIPVDSMTFRGVGVDSVSYPADSGFIRNFGGVAQLWWRGRGVQYIRDGTVDTLNVRSVVTVMHQSPDTLFFSPDPSGATPLPTVRTVPGTYVGGSWCRGEWNGERGAVTFTGVVHTRTPSEAAP